MKTVWATLLISLIPFTAAAFQEEKSEESLLSAGTLSGLAFRCIGPALMSGRIADIAIHPTDQSTWYIAVGSGNVWKTENAGTTWRPVFERYSSYSIGCVTIDPNNPEVVWVGTGENVSGRHVGYGDGVYMSANGGDGWENMGLKDSEHIGKIVIDPRNSDVVFVAAEGPLWASGGERGVYKSSDGGKTWGLVLEISENTGVTDIVFDPRNPDVLFAAAYQRRRHIWAHIDGGPESGIYKSVDGGATWRKLKKGLPMGDVGRIGLAISPQNPDVVYATIEAAMDAGGFYRSADSGESWEKRNSYHSGGTGPHYYQEIFADPHQFDRVIQMDVRMRATDDGGRTFNPVGEQWKHSDNHALAFDPGDPNYLLCGSDGGLYESFDRGKTWKFFANLPVTQFYKVALDNDFPVYNVYGGTQDNNTQGGPSRTLNVHGIRNSDWFITVGGDGYDCDVDPEDPNIVYSEWQNGGLVRYDRTNGETVDIQPQPAPDEPPERWNWDAPIMISPHSHTRLYFGSQRVWRSDDRGDSWRPISPDLSRGINRFTLKMMGRLWGADAIYDLSAMSNYSNLTTLSESPLVEGLIYAGTDDGLIQVTEDGGENWRRIDTFPGVPEMSFVNEVKASVHDPDTVFALFDNHKKGDFKPYILKSTDRGLTWTSIAGNMPDRHIVWSIVQDHVNKDLLFAGTEFGIFFTIDGGERWIKLTGGLPTMAFRDLEIQRRENDLVGASFGRGFYILDDYTPLRNLSEEKLGEESVLFPVKKASLYVQASTLGGGEKASQGGDFFTAPNPPFGAVFTYYLKDSLKTRKDVRHEEEKKIKKEGGDVAYPSWDELRAEDREEDPAIFLTISDEDGNVIRRITGPARSGIHRVAWDLRYPSSSPTQLERAGMGYWRRSAAGPMAAPGTYTVSLAKRVEGVVTSLAETQTFEVEALGISALPPQDKAEVLTFQKKTGELQRAILGAGRVIEDASERIRYIKKALDDTPEADPELPGRARDIEKKLFEARDQLFGDPTFRGRSRSEPTSPSIFSRVMNSIRGSWDSTYGPTQTHRRNYEYAAEAFEELLPELRAIVEEELVQLEEALEAAGAPWTPGRKIPGWKR